jgi:hypothetical protein
MAGKPADTTETWPAIVRYDGVFDWDGLYKSIINYLRRQNYWFYEKVYKSKPWSPIGTELVLKWEAHRKLDEYYQYQLIFEWHFMDFHYVDVIREGKKVTLTKAYFWVDIRGSIVTDWQGMESSESAGTVTKFLGKFFRKHVDDREWLYNYLYPLYDEVMDVQKFIQDYIHFESTRTGKMVATATTLH